ncbi:MAG: four helix bundle protein [Kofleriaceae bacterium]
MFDHEKLDAYRIAIEFCAWAGTIIEAAGRGRPNALKHLDESSSSVALNIAEGNGKRSVPDRVRFLEIARGSALECAACLDVLVARRHLEATTAVQGKTLLVRVVSMITKLIERLLQRSSTSTSTSTSTTRY